MRNLCITQYTATAETSLWCGAFLILDIFPQPPEVVFDSRLQVVGRITGLVLTGLFSGFRVDILATPVNSILFSRYAVINKRRNKLRIRYWIRQPERSGLCKARIDVNVLDNSESNLGETDIYRHFTYSEPRDALSIPYEEYSFIRGVRFVDIDLDQRFSGPLGNTLREVLDKLAHSDDTELSVTIVGSLFDGRVLTRRVAYTKKSVVQGCDFPSIRRDEFANEWEHAQNIDSLKNRHFGEFRCRGKPSPIEGLNSVPDDLFVFPRGMVAGRFFRLWTIIARITDFLERAMKRVNARS